MHTASITLSNYVTHHDRAACYVAQKMEERAFTDLLGPYMYCKTCDDNKYHVSVEVTGQH